MIGFIKTSHVTLESLIHSSESVRPKWSSLCHIGKTDLFYEYFILIGPLICIWNVWIILMNRRFMLT